MDLPRPEPGLVIRYGFLWSDEAAAGAETARKARPCAVVVALARADAQLVVTVVPITHRPPTPDMRAVEMPPVVKTRLGLDDMPSWIITHETNVFRWPGPDLEPVSHEQAVYGLLPARLYEEVRRRILEHRKAGGLSLTPRSD